MIKTKDIHDELIQALKKYIQYMSPGFEKLPSDFQDIIINAFVAGYTAKGMQNE